MIQGEVEPPGVFLNASAVLERQITAFCFDRWVETGPGENALPLQLRQVLGNITSKVPARFPYNFLSFVQLHRTELLDRFLAVFSKSLTEDSTLHLRLFLEGDQDSQGSLPFRILDGLFQLFKERESLKGKVKSLRKKIRIKQDNPVKNKNYQEELDELVREKGALQSLVTRINDRHTLNFMTDEGLLPNYAFPEAGVILRSIIYRRKTSVREGESRYETFTLDYERPAVSAISELAPANRFYAGGRRVCVDQVDLAVSEIEAWRFCNNCTFHGLVAKTPQTSSCPQCGSVLWSDSGQKRQMIRMRQVFATTSDRESRITDDSDDREPSFYNKQMMIGYHESDITDAYRIDSDAIPFGLEFLKKVTLREINFGEKEDTGEKVTIAGVESPPKGFVVCRHCGKIQDRRPRDVQHALWCPTRKKETAANLAECVYLYREFASEAILMLLPVTTFEGSERKLHSFIAALHLGLKKTFGGNIDHLQTAVHEEPVPGGTGYLKQLMRSEQPLLNVFEQALLTLRACPCNQDPAKDGCYQCLYAYRRSHYMAGTSRQAAVEMLTEIVRHRDNLVRIDSLRKIEVNALFDSELEARFIEALRRVRTDEGPAKLTKEVVNGKPGYFYRLGARAYYIEPQAVLGKADGVAVPSKVDFLVRPARAQDGVKPVAVFTDGFFYHKERIGQDMAQRCAIARSGKFHVWSLSWRDVEHQYKNQGAYFSNYLTFQDGGCFEKYNRLVEQYGVKRIPKLSDGDSFEWLIRFLAAPDADRWAHHAFVHALLHLDYKLFSAKEKRLQWRQDLWTCFPEDIAQAMAEPIDTLLHGLFPPQGGADFVRLFVAVDKTDVQSGNLAGLHAACCLFDGPKTRGHADFEAAWNGYLRLYNLFQFLPKAFFSTQEGKATGQPYEGSATESSSCAEPGIPSQYSETRGLTAEELKGIIDLLARRKGPLPEVGFELAQEQGEVIAEAEMGWSEKKIAVLLPEQSHYGPGFVKEGWRIFPAKEVLADPEAFVDLIVS